MEIVRHKEKEFLGEDCDVLLSKKGNANNYMKAASLTQKQIQRKEHLYFATSIKR